MNLTITPEKVPLRTNADGTVLVGQTRVPLETVVHGYQQYQSPEAIVQSYSSLSLAEVYLVIAYYLQHEAEVDAYLAEQDHQAAAIRREIEAQPGYAGLRDRLLARQAERESQECSS
ncbi:MAG: DUF433 domain-containing protein [Chloroflexota bacterium]|nr:DUF433 domain-containing protein [Chloroflexota bacterium]